MASGISLRGDAWTWWKNASADYSRGERPKPGAVLVFQRSGSMRRGHVAVVRQVVGKREMIIDHANWAARRSAKGRIEKGIRVIDVSAHNDWSNVRVWYRPADDFGTKVYPTYGFIYARDHGRDAPPSRMAGIGRLPSRPISSAPANTVEPTPVATPVTVAALSPAVREGRLNLAEFDDIDLDQLAGTGTLAPMPRPKPGVPQAFAGRVADLRRAEQRLLR